MKKLSIILVSLFIFACGEDPVDQDVEKSLIGTWLIDLSSTGHLCSLGLVIVEDGQYESDYVCELESGNFGIEAEVGVWTLVDDRVIFDATHTSCPSYDYIKQTNLGYEVNGNYLKLMDLTGVIIFERMNTIQYSSTLAQYGCWENYYFSPGNVVEL
jgi:hypothetical protein